MQLKDTKIPTLPQKIREEHTPQKGDVFLYKTFSDNKKIIRLEEQDEYGNWKTSIYSFMSNDFTEKGSTVSLASLKEYYELFLHPLDELLQEAQSVLEGRESTFTLTEDTTALMRSGKDRLIALHDDINMKQDRALAIQNVIQCKINSVMNDMKEKMESLQPMITALNRQVEIIEQVLSWLQAYLGQEVEAQTICTGEGAPSYEPLTIRQRILFMDEEVAIVNEDGQGLDYLQKEAFYEWMKDARNRDIILPELRCAVVMKPKRYDHHYTHDSYANRIINQNNRHSFIMIRNGENIHVIESENLEIYGTAIPTRKAYESIAQDKWLDDDKKQDETRRLQSRTMFYMMLLQGLIDNTELFGTHNPINITQSENTSIIYDAEEDTMIGTGIKPWDEWLKEQSQDIKRGSRIVFLADGGRNDGRFLRYYFNEYSEPERPHTGLYSVDESEHGELLFKYLPNDDVFNQSEGWYGPRKNRVSYIFNKGNAINFDKIDLNQLEMYLKDRTQRHRYRDMLRYLLQVKKIKKEELEMENHFIRLLSTDILKEHPTINEDILQKEIINAISWWKYKVIFKRPLSQNDMKSWRMIRNKVISSFQKENL